MLNFFRTYQRYFFIVITVVIIISFSFFGTYDTMGSSSWREQIAFKAVDGSSVSRYDLDEMATFLTTDNEDKVSLGGFWGPNFLNDGVIRKDFLETGLAIELASFYLKDFQEDLQRRAEKEKRYKLYTHPQARFLSVQSAWDYFLPELHTYFKALIESPISTDQTAFSHRVKLYLAEKKFPSSTLRQVLKLQERQYNWIEHDPNLDRIDFSLFGYHTVDDWFGPRFTRLVSQFIINTAILAQQKGYYVSTAEALADLVLQADQSYQQNKNNPYIGVTSSAEYFNEQLRRMNMDQGRAAKIWQQVLLFRRYFQDVGHTALVDVFSAQQFQGYGQETVTVDVYQLPKSLHINDYAALQKFEAYIQTVAKIDPTQPLHLPTQFLSVNEVAKNYPELVQNRYLLEIHQADKKSLQVRVPLREMWNWEVENWTQLTKQFPELGTKKGESREERLAIIDNLNDVTRTKIDALARLAIVDQHPEWIAQALDQAKPQIITLGLRNKGGKMSLVGLEATKKRQELKQLLDHATLNEDPQKDAALYAFTADQNTYYRIKVLEKAAEPEILTFAEANTDDTLNTVKDRLLEKYYVTIRDKNPLLYQKEDQSWKDFAIVKDLVADSYFETILNAIATSTKNLSKEKTTKDQKAALRFYTYLKDSQARLIKDPTYAMQLIQEKPEQDSRHLSKRLPLAQQWRLEKIEQVVNHQEDEEAFKITLKEWSSIKTNPNGEMSFFQVTGKELTTDHQMIAQQTQTMHQLLSAEIQRTLMRKVLTELQSKGAISLNYLSAPQDESSATPEMES